MNQIRRQSYKFLGWFFLTALSLGVTAAPLPDDQQEINVDAGWSEIDLKNGVWIHHKPVVVTQGSRRLESDLLTISRGTDGKVDKIVAQGNPARYQGLTDADPKSPLLHAKAQNITWDARNEKLILTGNAQVEQNGDTYSAPVLEYYLKENRAISPKNKQGRTKIVLQPRPGSELSLTGMSKP
jgi:lipopolysaccharide export system protein LptA